MGFEELKNWPFTFFKKLARRDLFNIFVSLRNVIEEQNQELKESKEENQKLRDTINKLQGEKGKPDIKPSKDPDDKNDDNKRAGGLPNKNHKSGGKKKAIKVDRGSPSRACWERVRPWDLSFVKHMHTEGRITQNVMLKIVTGMGINISAGQIANIIMGNKGIDFESEMEAARIAGMKKQDHIGIDDTGARIEGKNGATIVTGNDYFAAYLTFPSKNRLAACTALAGVNKLPYCLNKIAIKYIDGKISNKKLVKMLRKMVSEFLHSEIEFVRKILSLPWVKNQITAWKKHIRDACAIGALRSRFIGPRTSILICDDDPQFKGILEELGLCWIHEGRHYKKLEPCQIDFKEEKERFLKKFLGFYEKLKKYKLRPTARKRVKLREEFDEIFAAESNYYALNSVMRKTREKKEMLLLVLDRPGIPLHNNGSEIVIREIVVQRKIRNCFRSWVGARASDLSLGLMATCRKVKISFGEYLKDRFYFSGQIAPLAKIIQAVP